MQAGHSAQPIRDGVPGFILRCGMATREVEFVMVAEWDATLVIAKD
jgi:hypothetical protein